MPSIAAHMVVAKLVSEKLNMDSEDFIKGNLLPDIIKSNDSHHRIPGKMFSTVDIEYFKNNLDLNNYLYLGCYTHLLLDSYYEEEYLPSTITYKDIFKDGVIYKEYDMINYQLVNKFNLDVDYLKDILSGFDVEVDKDKLDLNIKCLQNKEIGNPIYLKFEPFSEFLEEVSLLISEEIENYANKSS